MGKTRAGNGSGTISRSRLSVVLVTVGMLIALSGAWPPHINLAPHVIYRVPLALAVAVGLWTRMRWAYPLLWVTAAVWLLVFAMVVPFLLVASPWVLWRPWLYWIVPTALVVTPCVLMSTAAGRSERGTWTHGTISRSVGFLIIAAVAVSAVLAVMSARILAGTGDILLLLVRVILGAVGSVGLAAIVALIPAGIYRLFKRARMPGFDATIWVVWSVYALLSLLGSIRAL